MEQLGLTKTERLAPSVLLRSSKNLCSRIIYFSAFNISVLCYRNIVQSGRGQNADFAVNLESSDILFFFC